MRRGIFIPGDTKRNFYMMNDYIEGLIFSNLKGQPEKGEYENCTFISCDFSETDLSDLKFSDCIFKDCNLSLAKIFKTAFRDVEFAGCKLLGLSFHKCTEMGLAFSFKNCTLDHASFAGTKIKKTIFNDCKICEADFSDCDLSFCAFNNCDLNRSIFLNTNMEKTDFRTAYNISFDPELNKIKKTKFSLNGLPGLLSKFDLDIRW